MTGSPTVAELEPVALRRARRRSVLLGWALTVVGVALGGFVLASPDRRPWFQSWDDAWRRWMIEHRTPWLVDLARALSVVGSGWVLVPLRVAIGVVLLVRRRWVQLGAFATAMVVSALVVAGAKALTDRPRPPGGLVDPAGSSFPSGHAAGAAVTAFGIVVAFLPRGARRWRWIVAATAAATIMSWSRTYLSVHWASDTVAGSAIGVACALLVEAVFEERSAKADAEESTPDGTAVGVPR